MSCGSVIRHSLARGMAIEIQIQSGLSPLIVVRSEALL